MPSLYQALTLAGAAIAVPALRLRAGSDPEARRRAAQRLGRIDAWTAGEGASRPARRLWLQAVSVGEVRLAETFLASLKERHRSLGVAVSSTTAAGLASARRLAEGTGALADRTFAFPLDLPWVVRRVLDRLEPAAFGSVETEIWPGLLTACRRRGIPVLMVNGSLSARSARRLGWLGGAVREGLSALRAACMQTQADADRLESLGAPGSSIVVTGNLKFDGKPAGAIAAKVGELRAALDIPEGSRVLVAGSTSPGEEAILLEAWRGIASRLAGARLVIAPRHPDRFEEVASLVAASGIPFVRRSAREKLSGATGGVILLDTLGELEAAYGLASAAFVGGSLVPRGGQNPIEPARLGVPVLFGPGMDNFEEVASDLAGCGGAFVVADARALQSRALELMTDEAAGRRSGEAARRLVEAGAGATRRTIEALERRLPEIFS